MNYILPCLILLLLLYALAKGVNIYEAFVRGAGNALPMLLHILPYMTAMLAGLTVFRQTGALDRLVGWIAPFARGSACQKNWSPSLCCGPSPAAPRWPFYRTSIPNTARTASWAIAHR